MNFALVPLLKQGNQEGVFFQLQVISYNKNFNYLLFNVRVIKFLSSATNIAPRIILPWGLG